VLGTGIDVCYLKENEKLYEKVLERRAIISEFPTGWHPAPGKSSGEEQNYRGNADRGGDCGWQTVWRVADYGAAGNGVWEKGVCGAGERDTGRELCAESTDQARREAGDRRGRCD
jgi:hypothetical protein